MHGAIFTSDALAPAGPEARRFAVRCMHAITEFDYRPAALPPVLWLTDADVARLLFIRHAAAGHCTCTPSAYQHPAACG